MRRQYVFEMSVYIDADCKAKLNSFADRMLPQVMDAIRMLRLFEEGTPGTESYKKMTLKSVTVRRKNQRREP